MLDTTIDRPRPVDTTTDRPDRRPRDRGPLLPVPAHDAGPGGPRSACDVLERARTVVARGWMQRGWYAVRPGSRPRRARWLADRSPTPEEIGSACLVGAVVVAAHRPGTRIDVVGAAGPALDLVWDALAESHPGPGRTAAGRAAPREWRIARMRDLTRWNDAAGRTRDDVLALLDRAIARAAPGATARTGGA